LYVGKAKNLSHRAGPYRVAKYERMARPTPCEYLPGGNASRGRIADEVAAVKRESELLSSLKRGDFVRVFLQGPKRFLVGAFRRMAWN